MYQLSPKAENISIHALLAESDLKLLTKRLCDALISIHALLAESDKYHTVDRVRACISIHALLADSDLGGRAPQPPQGISIHALLAESDFSAGRESDTEENFYPRSPCGERPYIMTTIICTASFLSTLSLRRATCIIDIINNVINNFYPRSPCGERPTALAW